MMMARTITMLVSPRLTEAVSLVSYLRECVISWVYAINDESRFLSLSLFDEGERSKYYPIGGWYIPSTKSLR